MPNHADYAAQIERQWNAEQDEAEYNKKTGKTREQREEDAADSLRARQQDRDDQ